jgi:hypothetical protein
MHKDETLRFFSRSLGVCRREMPGFLEILLQRNKLLAFLRVYPRINFMLHCNINPESRAHRVSSGQ